MKSLIFFFILSLFFFSCDKNSLEKQENSFYISGNLKNISDSTKVYLKVQESNRIIPLDTTYIINNTFIFKGKINKPEVYGIYFDSIKGSIGLFLQNDSISINVNKNKLGDSKITGSELNDKYLSFTKKSNQIISKTNYLFPLFQKARTENNVEKLQKINEQIETIHRENITYVLDFARNNPDSYISAYALQTLLKGNSVPLDTIATIYNNFSHEVKTGDFAIEILLYLENQKNIEN